MHSLLRNIQLALDNLWRNKLLTLATVLIMGLILFIFNIIFTVNVLSKEAIHNLEDKVDLIIYLQDNADTLLVNQLVQDLSAFPETETVTYISKDEALVSLLDKYADDVNPFTQYDLENPLPASIQVITEKPEDHETLLAYIEQSSFGNLFLEIESNQENREIVENLIQITAFTEKLLYGILLAFLIGSAMIIANAIHLTIFSRKKEIDIMRLVGASYSFIRSPFLIEGAFYGISAVIIGMVLLLLFVQNLELMNISFLSIQIPYFRLVLFQLILSLLMGMGSSWIATNYYFKHSKRV